VRLGGPSTYGGVASHKPPLGEPTEPLTEAKARQAVGVMLLASWLALGLALPVRFAMGLVLPF
jgi:cobalamin biosynthesis protein CobD/CbiB